MGEHTFKNNQYVNMSVVRLLKLFCYVRFTEPLSNLYGTPGFPGNSLKILIKTNSDTNHFNGILKIVYMIFEENKTVYIYIRIYKIKHLLESILVKFS